MIRHPHSMARVLDLTLTRPFYFRLCYQAPSAAFRRTHMAPRPDFSAHSLLGTSHTRVASCLAQLPPAEGLPPFSFSPPDGPTALRDLPLPLAPLVHFHASSVLRPVRGLERRGGHDGRVNTHTPWVGGPINTLIVGLGVGGHG